MPTVITPPAADPAAETVPVSWVDSLPDDIRGDKTFEPLRGKKTEEALSELAKMTVHAQRMIGADKVALPGKDATADQMSEFYNKTGRPETLDGYEFALPEGLTNDDLDASKLAEWKQELFDAGVSKTAAARIISKYLASEHTSRLEATTGAETQLKTWDTEARTRFGDKFDETANHARYALKELGNPGLAEILDQTGMGSHPDVIEFFAKAGRTISEQEPRGSGFRAFSANTPEQAQTLLTQFNRDPSKQAALFDNKHAQHASVIKERQELFMKAFPSMSEE
jgi:ribosomal protein L22